MAPRIHRVLSEREKPVSNHIETTLEPNAETGDTETGDAVIAATANDGASEMEPNMADFADNPADGAAAATSAEEEGGHSEIPEAATTSADKEQDEDFTEDGRADDALDFVVDVLGKMGMDCTVDLMENGPNEPDSDVRIEISGEDSNRIIGRKGQTLSALQFLTNRVVNRPPLDRRHVLIDADGYRQRREGALSQMAKKLGKQAVSEHKVITFEPMSAQDRRIVHLALAKFPGVVTKSEGRGASRRVQILPVDED